MTTPANGAHRMTPTVSPPISTPSTATSARSCWTSPIPTTSPAPANWWPAPTSWWRTSGPGPWRSLAWATTTLRALQPDLIYCAITGFGRDGGADLPGYDLLVQAVGGLMSITGPEPGEPDESGCCRRRRARRTARRWRHPDRAGTPRPHRARPAGGHRSALGAVVLHGQSGVRLPGRRRGPGIMGNRHPSIAPYQTFSTADRPIARRRRQRQTVQSCWPHALGTARARRRRTVRLQPAASAQPRRAV